MPAFMFEKISPPVPSGQQPSIPKKQRGVIHQILDRLADARAKRGIGQARSVFSRRKEKSTDAD
jgi:hypothetical protein